MVDTYEISMYCLNCGMSYDSYGFEIKKPITKDILKKLECHYCECNGFLIKNFELPEQLLHQLTSNKNKSNLKNKNGSNHNAFTPALIGFGFGLLLGD